jgi:hypothetical protein
LEAKPIHVVFDRIDVLDIFLARIGVVETQIAPAAELGGEAKIEANRLGVADVQIAIRLRRKPSVDSALIFALLEILSDNVAYEMRRRRLSRAIFGIAPNCFAIHVLLSLLLAGYYHKAGQFITRPHGIDAFSAAC